MTTAEQLLKRKRIHTLAWLEPSNSVLDAANKMNEWRIGSVLVMLDGRMIGIVTERDVLTRVVAAGLDPATTRLEDVMTSPVACARPDTTLDELRMVMRHMRIRHVPVVDEKEVCGMISLGDLNEARAEIQEQTIQYLEQYISAT